MKKLLLSITFILLSTTVFGQKIDNQKLKELLSRAKETNSEAVIIYHNGKLISESYFGLGHKDTLIECMSTTKSIVGLAVACLLNDGLLDSLDVPVYKFYPEWNQGTKKYITIRHLVNMTSGLQNVPNTQEEIYPSKDFVQLALAAEMTTFPGKTFSYNNKSLNLMSGIFQKITGKRMDIYIGERLFKPLDITKYTWTLDDAGNPHVMSGCQIRPSDHIKMGLLLLNKGKYNGKQIIGEKFALQVVEPCKQYKEYGQLWWLDYEEKESVIDDEIINAMIAEKLDPEFIEKVKLMKGKYDTYREFYNKVVEVFGENPGENINKAIGNSNVKFRKTTFKGDATYRADGYLGNYIIVNPKKSLVALRMTSHKSAKTQNDYFPEFASMVLKL